MPYAEAPVGELRFAGPRAVRGWGGVRVAESFGPPPPQAGVLATGARTEEGAGDGWLSVMFGRLSWGWGLDCL
nr:carboxylesterase family protein [Kribbella pittospori]